MNSSRRPAERGGVLVVALVFLVVLGLLGLASMNTGRIELRLSNNVEARSTAYQAAQALADAVVATPAMTPVIGGAGYRLCTPGVTPCDDESLYMPAGPLADLVDDGELSGTATMTAPSCGPPRRGLGFSADKFCETSFQLDSEYDNADASAGRVGVTAGLSIMTPIY